MIIINDTDKSPLDSVLFTLVVTLPIALVSGPFIPDLFVVISTILMISYVFKKKIFILFKSKFLKLLIFFYLWCLFCSFISSDVLLSFESSLFYFRFIFLIMAIIYVQNKFEIKFFNILYYLFLFLLIVILFSQLYELIQSNSYSQISGIFGKEQKSGSFVARFYPLIVGLILFNKNIFFKNKIHAFFICFILSSLILILSAERVALVLFFLGNIIFFILYKDLRKSYSFVIIGSTLLIFVLSNFLFTNQTDRIVNTTLDQIKQNDQIIFFSKHHESHYKTALNMFYENPITGIGPKLFRVKCNDPLYRVIYDYSEFPLVPYYLVPNYGCATHPHNNYLQLLAEVGIVGFIVIIFLFFLTIRKFYYYYKNSSFLFNKYPEYTYLSIASLVCIFISLFPLLPTGSFFNNWINIIYFFPVGIFLYTDSKIKLHLNK